MEHMGMENSQFCQNPVICWEIPKTNPAGCWIARNGTPFIPTGFPKWLVPFFDWSPPTDIRSDSCWNGICIWHAWMAFDSISQTFRHEKSDILSDSHLQSVWHAIGPCIMWQSIWHSTSHVYTCISFVWPYLKHILTFCLTCLFHLTYSLAWKIWHVMTF